MYVIDWDQVQATFYSLMASGWASNTPSPYVTITDTMGAFTPPPDEKYSLTDIWTITPKSYYSSGTTLISQRFENAFVPIWTMHYWGFYTKAGSSFLKTVLNETYSNPGNYPFCGCRGPGRFVKDQSWYENNLRPGSTFRKFSGTEIVVGPTAQSEGYHDYSGLSLVPQI